MSITICIYPSAALVNTCSEVDIVEPVYVDISGHHSVFQYKVQLKCESGCVVEGYDEITATGFSFRDPLEARESAALAGLDVLFCFHGIKTALFNDIGFVDMWSSYNDLCENFKGTTAGLEQLMSEISALIGRLGESQLLFDAEKRNCDRCLTIPPYSAPWTFAILN